MARKYDRMALYEAIKRGQSKFAGVQKKNQEKLETEVFAGQIENATNINTSWLASAKATRRFTLSMPYPVALMFLVIIAGLFLVAFWQGRKYERRFSTSIGVGLDADEQDSLAEEDDSSANESETKNRSESEVDEKLIFEPVKDHVVVITVYKDAEHLKPVQEYFLENGVETVIEKRGIYYFLMTKERYQSPKLDSSKTLNSAVNNIRKIGADYKAPPEFETFGAKPFQDSYGMKISN